MSIVIKPLRTIQVVISFDGSDDITDSTVKDAIEDVARSVGANPCFVEVVSEENKFIASITATDEDLSRLVNALKLCLSTRS